MEFISTRLSRSGRRRPRTLELLEPRWALDHEGGDSSSPRVIDVAVRGASGAHPWYDMPVGSGDQLRSVPVGQVDQISVTFDTDVQIDANDITLTGLGDRPPYTFSNFSYDSGTHTAIWTMSSPLDRDQLLLVLNADGSSPITNLAGDALDGEWKNPSSLAQLSGSLFPSGNGAPGGDFVFDWRVSPGDANGDYLVDGADYVTWSDNFFLIGGGATVGDFNTDGVVDGADYIVWADHFSPALPAAPAAGPTVAVAPNAIQTELLSLPETSAEALAQSPPAILAAVTREAIQNVRSQIGEPMTQTSAVDLRMHDLSLAATTHELGIDELIGEIARGRGRLGRS